MEISGVLFTDTEYEQKQIYVNSTKKKFKRNF
jgi:hypothetical protein